MTAPLEKFEILREMSPEERDSLRDFLEERSFADGRAIFRRLDDADALLLLIDGRVRLESGGEDLGELAPGSALGHASLVSIGKRTCAAHAVGAVSLLELSREAYHRLRGDFPQIALALQEGLLRSFAETTRKVLPEA
jgi:CRP-like cAMP-binding protein